MESNKTLKVIAAVEDLIFSAMIKSVAEQVSAEIKFVKSYKAALKEVVAISPDILIIDLQCKHTEPFILAKTLKADETMKGIQLVGYFPHIHVALLHQAQEAGFDRILPRSAFVKQLPDLMKEKCFA